MKSQTLLGLYLIWKNRTDRRNLSQKLKSQKPDRRNPSQKPKSQKPGSLVFVTSAFGLDFLYLVSLTPFSIFFHASKPLKSSSLASFSVLP
jgi:hypothetical protein